MTLPDHCWIMMTTTVMMTPADGFQNNCGTFTNNILIDILKEFHVYFSVKISSWLRFSHTILSFDSWQLLWWFTSENMDFVTQLETLSMFTDAYSRLIAYTFEFNLLLSVTDPHYGLDKYTGVLLLPSASTAMWWSFSMTMSLKSDIWYRVRLLNLSLRLLQAQHSLSVVLLFICILVSIKIEVDVPTSMASSCSTSTIYCFCSWFQPLWDCSRFILLCVVFFMRQW